MGTKERRLREVAEREQLFIDRARDLVCHEGLLQLQMARLAEACDYATGTLYQHFASKEDLVVALLTDRVGERIELFRRAAQWPGRPRDRMFAIAVAETIFVERNPEYFRIEQLALTEVVWSAASLERRTAYLKQTRPIGEIVLDIVRDGGRRRRSHLAGRNRGRSRGRSLDARLRHARLGPYGRAARVVRRARALSAHGPQHSSAAERLEMAATVRSHGRDTVTGSTWRA